ncbi:hypothetical protein B0H21DRAFT_657271, partial [Amylocystis lapponica]
IKHASSNISCSNKFPPSTKFQIDSYHITLLEIPSLDSASAGAELVLNVAGYLSSKSKGHTSISDVIYLHPMTENQLVGSDKRTYDLFQHLCGDEAFRNTIIVTNKWHKTNREVGERLERDLKSKDIFFKPALDRCSEILRLDYTPAWNNTTDARNIVRKFFKKDPIPLLIQHELVAKRMRFSDTTTGIELLEHIASME